MRADFDAALGAARGAYERNDMGRSLKYLERARRIARKQEDEHALRRVLDFVEGSVARDERTEIARENLVYAVRQNLRQATRKRALAAHESWVDPYPDLEGPREHTRTFVSRGVKFWIAGGVALGLVVVAGLVVAVIIGALSSSGDELRLRVRNDTGGRVTVRWCDTAACDGDYDPIDTMHLEPGEYARHDLPGGDIVDIFVVDGASLGHACLPVRVDRTYETLADASAVVAVRVSEATPCPGEIVTPVQAP